VQAVREAYAGDELVSELIDAMLDASAALWKQHVRLHNLVFKLVASHKLCCRFMQIPAVGPPRPTRDMCPSRADCREGSGAVRHHSGPVQVAV